MAFGGMDAPGTRTRQSLATPLRHKDMTGLQLMLRRVKHGHFSVAVNLTPVSRDPVSKAERIAQWRLCVDLDRTRVSDSTCTCSLKHKAEGVVGRSGFSYLLTMILTFYRAMHDAGRDPQNMWDPQKDCGSFVDATWSEP